MRERRLLALTLGIVALGLQLMAAQPRPTERPPAVSDQAASERFWRKQLEPILPKDWVVKSVKPAAAPVYWDRTAGEDGVEVFCENPKETIKDRIAQPYHPFLSVWIMPDKWEGHNREDPTEKVEKSSYYPGHPETWDMHQVYPARYLGKSSASVFGDSRHFFRGTVGQGDWTSASKDLAARFSLCPVPPSERSRINR